MRGRIKKTKKYELFMHTKIIVGTSDMSKVITNALNNII
jgi:hypothetical protein